MEISIDVANRFILEKSHLTDATKTDNMVQILEDLLGLHATTHTTPYISLFCRGKNLTTSLLYDLFFGSKNIAKIRCVRGTVFVQYQSLIPVMHMSTLDLRMKQTQKRLEIVKLNTETITDLQGKILSLLKNNPLTTREIRDELETEVDLSSVLFYLADLGLIVRSKPRKDWMDRMHTYELFEDAIPHCKIDSISKENAIKQLIFQYIAKYGPVCEEDITWWTGFNKTSIKKSLMEKQDSITTIDIVPFDRDFYILKNEVDILQDLQPLHESVVSLLPCLDPYIMGYKFRDRYIEEYGKEYIFDRSGNATNVMILNGRVVGTWDWEVENPALKFFVFGKMSMNQKNLMQTQFQELGRFLFKSPFEIIEKHFMEPLTKKTAGWVLKPLRD